MFGRYTPKVKSSDTKVCTLSYAVFFSLYISYFLIVDNVHTRGVAVYMDVLNCSGLACLVQIDLLLGGSFAWRQIHGQVFVSECQTLLTEKEER